MTIVLEPVFNIAIDGHHVWCPSVFLDGDRLRMAVAAWPQSSGFEGWRTHSRLAILTMNDDLSCAESVNFQNLDLPMSASVINPRVSACGGQCHLFCSIVVNSFNYEIGYGVVTPDSSRPVAIKTLRIDQSGHATDGQGPTNPAPMCLPDGQWRMLYRTSSGVGQKRTLRAAMSSYPDRGWRGASNPIVAKGDIEDPFVWHTGVVTRALVRDIDGAISGKTWASIAMMETKDWTCWQPAKTPHICNRSVPLPDGSSRVMYRLERPAFHEDRSGRSMLIMAALEHPESLATIRGFRTQPSL